MYPPLAAAYPGGEKKQRQTRTSRRLLCFVFMIASHHSEKIMKENTE